MRLLTVSIIILVLTGGILFWYCSQSTNPATDDSLEIKSTETLPRTEAENMVSERSSANPVSLPALMEKTYDGHDFRLGRILDDNSAYTRYIITYQSEIFTISGIMNIPKGIPPASGWPVLFLNHGYIDPAIYTNGRGLKREQDYLARRGYAVIHSDYRNHAESDDDPENELNFRLGYTVDIINAITALRKSKLPGIDTERIGMLGHSMGGGVTLNTLVVAPELVDAAVLFAPVSANYERNYERWTRSDSDQGKRIIERYGTPEQSPEFWNGISAKNYFDRIATPIQNHHGTADASVEIKWSDELDLWLKAAGKSHEYLVYPGEPHEFVQAWPLVMARTLAFFDEHVKGQ
ncbi:MAG: alpha/beta fold hydrolase [Candidatus Moraniibacteriota bacterium]